jgi:predicted short-subunit dehydrogenase-like oxidoreductase (DUF2520 family)
MALRIAIVGPGRVGTAFARRFVQAGASFVGFVGRDRAATAKQVAAVGSGAVLAWPDLHKVHVVVFAVGDGDLAKAVEQAASIGGRPCSLWLHTSGRHGLEVFASAELLGVRTGSLHPLLPFSGSLENINMASAPAVAAGPPRSKRLLKRLAAMLQLAVIEWRAGDGDKQNRTLYHAGCVLAANGATALFGMAADLVRGAGGLDRRDGDAIVAALMNAAVRAASEHGADRALSGPVRRGDAETVALHLAALQDQAAVATPTYVALMQQALLLARDQGLAPADCERVAAALSLLRPSS